MRENTEVSNLGNFYTYTNIVAAFNIQYVY